jgi:hypothetical protein
MKKIFLLATLVLMVQVVKPEVTSELKDTVDSFKIKNYTIKLLDPADPTQKPFGGMQLIGQGQTQPKPSISEVVGAQVPVKQYNVYLAPLFLTD